MFIENVHKMITLSYGNELHLFIGGITRGQDRMYVIGGDIVRV